MNLLQILNLFIYVFDLLFILLGEQRVVVEHAFVGFLHFLSFGLETVQVHVALIDTFEFSGKFVGHDFEFLDHSVLE